MATKPKNPKKSPSTQASAQAPDDAPAQASARTLDDWFTSPIGSTAVVGRKELDDFDWILHDEGMDTASVREMLEAGIARYNEVMKAWLSGDDENAIWCVYNLGMAVGSLMGYADAKHLKTLFGKKGRAAQNNKEGSARANKQAAKDQAHALWKERRAGRHPKLYPNEQFATECRRRWPVLKSATVILRWCTLWEKEEREKEKAARKNSTLPVE